MSYEQRSDDRLVAAALRGDHQAFEALYDRHFARLYDFAVRIVLDRDSAADVVQTTFIKTWELLRRGAAPRRFRPWMFTVARNAAIDELRHRKRVAPDRGSDEAFSEFNSKDPQTEYQSKELTRLVWQAAASLRPEDYSLLEMYIRQGLSADEMAEGLGVRKGTLYTRISRLKNALEQAVIAEMLIRTGRRDCEDLDGIVTEFQQPTDLRRAVQSHLKGCSACRKSRDRYASPIAIFAGLAPVPAPIGLKALLWGNISADAGVGVSAIEVLRSPLKFLSANKAASVGTAALLVGAAAVTVWQSNSFEAASLPIVDYIDLQRGDRSGARTRPQARLEKDSNSQSIVVIDATPTPTAEALESTSTEVVSSSAIAPPVNTNSATQTISPSDTPSATAPSPTTTPTASITPQASATSLPSNTPTSEPASATPTPSITPTHTPQPVTWESDPFDGLSSGPLAGQNGWFSSAASAQVVNFGGGKAVRIDPAGGSTVIMGKNVANQDSGLHKIELEVLVSGGSQASMAKLEVGTIPSAGWDKKFQLYFGSSFRINFSGSGGSSTIVASTEMDRWYRVRCEVDLDSNLVDVFVDGALAASEVSIHPGPIDSIGISGWDFPGYVMLDNLLGVRY